MLHAVVLNENDDERNGQFSWRLRAKIITFDFF